MKIMLSVLNSLNISENENFQANITAGFGFSNFVPQLYSISILTVM